MKQIDWIAPTILAYCCLHNLCIDYDDIDDYLQEGANERSRFKIDDSSHSISMVSENETETTKKVRLCKNSATKRRKMAKIKHKI